MPLSRPPLAALRPFVDLLWASEGATAPKAGAVRELVLPTGALHLVLRLDDAPLRVFRGPDDSDGLSLRRAVIGGARAAAYVKDIARPVPTVGALLRPGAAGLVLGAPAAVFTGAHWALEDVWGPAEVDRLRSRLAETATSAGHLDLFETALAARLPGVRGIDPRIAQALAGLRGGMPVAATAAACELSHRHFTARFRDAVGLAPKAWCRVHRFGRVLDRLAAEPAIAWAELAAAEGYADQAHFAREFRALAGLSPGGYRRRAPLQPRHVPL
ncbi:MAG: helix-turn-helix domain-containing protein [Bacteroidota bacterium]|nr:AraC family transcriptional regulator [Kiloniellaceae bacterium]